MVLTFKNIHYRLGILDWEDGSAMTSDWRDGFLFVGNHLALDFVNTRPVMDGRPVELLPDGSALARWLVASGLGSSSQSARLQRRWSAAGTTGAPEKLRDLRERFRREVIAIERGGQPSADFVCELNRLLLDFPFVDQLVSGESGLEQRKWFAAEKPEDAFAPIAHAMADLLSNVPADRLRQCRGCVLHFYDTSKKGTRQWCSMKICGNRSKVAAFAERRRGAEDQ
jgi:predicted RNA-binding Zn ribbon-like protein